MSDFLLELRSEEIPARMQGKAKEDLARLFGEAIAKVGLRAEGVETFATPRRLALIARGLPEATEAVSEETKGPKTSAPPQALEGFLRKTGLTQDQLTTRDGVYFAVIDKPGRATSGVLAEAIPQIVRAFPWPKSMRWGAASASTESLRWVRPLQGIVAILGEDVVPCEVDGVLSGYQTLGHRFHHPGPITIGGAHDYVEKLRACHVIVHFSERCTIIRDGAKAAAEAAGLVLVEDEGLVAENAGLTEWPVPMLGRFDPAFLAVPEEVIQLTARVNQKYFVCHDAEGCLANAFILAANIDATDGGLGVVAGNEKVLAARLSDAKFFWEQDLKVPLAVQEEKLSQIVFHEKLGTVADKVERVAKLARWLCEEGIVPSPGPSGHPLPQGERGNTPSPLEGEGNASAASEGEGLPTLAERAARLCKADLVTGMVGEFPELQGVMGGHIARAQGEPPEVADAIRDHYKPVGQGDDVPTAPVTVAVSLADKLDTIACFFVEDMAPTGSKDPFALRRAALAVLSLLTANSIRLRLSMALAISMARVLGRVRGEQAADDLFEAAQALDRFGVPGFGIDPVRAKEQLVAKLDDEAQRTYVERIEPASLASIDFFADRLKVQQREAGVRHDLIDAVFSLGGEDDLVRLLARVKALQGFVGRQEGADLLAAYKRAANILKSSPSSLGEGDLPQGGGGVSPGLGIPLHRPADGPPPQSEIGEDKALHTALDTAEPLAAAAITAEDFEAAMAALASLRAPIDAFFEGVMVNDEDPDKRAYRMGLLARFRDAVHRVADFSKIEG